MLKTTKIFKSVTSVSLLTFSAIVFSLPTYAGSLFKTTVKVVNVPPGASPTHDGNWVYDVQVVPGTPPQVKLTVKKTPGIVNGFNNDQFIGDMYTYNATESNGKYTFMGSSNGLNITMGMFTPSKMDLMIESPVTTTVPYEISNIMLVPQGREASEKQRITIPSGITRPGQNKITLSYMISQSGFREKIFSATTMADIKTNGNPLIGSPIMDSCTRAKNEDGKDLNAKFNCMLMFTVDLLEPTSFEVDLKTIADVRKKNELRKSPLTIGGTGIQPITRPLVGFSFTENSPGIYTLYNDSNENLTINRLAVKLNSSSIDLGAFDLDNPNLTDFSDLTSSPFALSEGTSVSFNLGVELLDGLDIFSQAFVDFTSDTTGLRSIDIQQHQHDPIPEPSSIVSLLIFGTFSLALKDKLKSS